MKPVWRGVLIGIAAYLVLLVTTAPAAKILPYVQPRLQNVQLSGVEGSLWSGNAMLVDAAPIQLSDVHWSFRPLALMMGRIELAIEGRLQEQAVRARVGSSFLGQPYLADVSGRVAAGDVLNWLGQRQVKLEGDLDFDIEEVEWAESGLPAVGGTVVWSPARVAGPVELALGKVQLDTRIQDGATRGKLETSGGALLVKADVEMQASGSYRLDAVIQQKGEVPQAVSKFLSTFAEYKNGSYRLEWSDTI